MRFLSSLVAVSFLALACASPPWDGMSQTDIEGWKTLGYSATESQLLKKKGVGISEAGQWKDAGIVGWESIRGWRDNKMSPAVAGDWKSSGFDSRSAAQWSKKKFQPSEAEQWKTAGKTLGEAVDGRAEGLMPISASTASDVAAEAKDAATDAASDAAADALGKATTGSE